MPKPDMPLPAMSPGPSQQECAALLALFNQGRLSEAEALARAFSDRFPQHAFAWKVLGALAQQAGRANDALVFTQKAVALAPDDAALHANLGILHYFLGQLHEAETSFRRMLQLSPAHARTHFHLGATLTGLGRIDEAMACHRSALSLDPDLAEAHSALGLLLKESGRLGEAEASFRQSLRIRPDAAEMHSNLGALLMELGREEEAMAFCQQALRINPGFVKAHNNLGILLAETGRLVEAEASYREATRLDPAFAQAHCNLGTTLGRLGRFDDAQASFKHALALQPDMEDAHCNLLFLLNYHPDVSDAEVFAAYRAYDDRFGVPHRAAWPVAAGSLPRRQRLRIGYVSPDYRAHSCRHFLEPLLMQHDRGAVEVFAYAELAREDAMTLRYRGCVDHWVPTKGLDDDALAQRIRADGIDILVDLAGHTRGNRLKVFARKPAPVSVSWLGFGCTTGLSAMDYFLTDAHSVPSGHEGLFSEVPWRLDGPAFAYRPASDMGEVNALPALQRGHITFGTLTRAVRINHRVVRAWSEILKRVPGSRLVVNSADFRHPSMQDRLQRQFGNHGIAPERLSIGYHSPPWDTLRGLDICLDCFPHNSGTTLFESLYMGVPFVTLAGRAGVGRLGSTILHGAGHPEWIADTEQAYVDMAVALAAEPAALQAQRAGLRDALRRSPLMDEARFARSVEAAYRQMWRAKGGAVADAPAPDPTPPVGTKPSAPHATADLDSPRIPAPSTSRALPRREDLEAAVSLFNQQRFGEAEPLARALTEHFPGSELGWKLLAAILRAIGRPQDALPCILRAVQLAPQDAEAHINLGNAYQDLQRWHEAEASYAQAIALDPDAFQAHANLASALVAQGRWREAEASSRQALQLQPGLAPACNHLGNALRGQGRLPEAEQAYRQALSLSPGFADAHGNLGAVLHSLGRVVEAEASCRRAVALKPQDAGLHNNLGNALRDLGHLAPAAQCYRAALALQPAYAPAHNGLGIAMRELGQLNESEACQRRAIQLRPDFAQACNDLSTVLHDQGRFDEAEAAARQALRISPHLAQAHGSLGNALRDQGRLAEALQSYRQALQAQPGYVPAHDNLLFTLNYDADATARDILAAYQAYEEDVGAPCRATWLVHANTRDARRRLKIGYVSPDFRQHACRHFLLPLLAHHDRQRFEVFAYAQLATEDTTTAEFRACVDHWVPTLCLDDAALARRIRDDGIDILVDLAGHTRGNRLPVFARKPAPVAVSWLGFGYTTGLKAIDYFLADAHTVPQADQALYSETPWRLSGPAFAYRPASDMGDAGPLPAQTRGHVTFGTLTRAVRLNDSLIAVWATILQQLPLARLVVDSADFRDPAMQQRLAARFAHHGIAPERLQVGHHSPPWDVLRGIDIMLDCFPHNSGTTLFESLYMGVPFVTLSRRAGVGRLGAAILQAQGRPEWIAQDETAYVQRAVLLAQDLPALSALRAQLRAQIQASPLMNEAGFARSVEQAYRAMWERWCATPQGTPQHTSGPSADGAARLLALYHGSRFADAEPMARAMTQAFPDQMFGWKILGAVLKQLGRPQEALGPMRQATLLAPDDAEAHNNLGVTLKELGHLAEAEASYRQALVARPDMAQSLSNLGHVLTSLGRPEEALACGQRAVALQPDLAAAHNNLGVTLKALDRFGEAALCFEQALAIAPRMVKARSNLASVLAHLGRHDDALRHSRLALDQQADFPQTHDNLLFALNYHPDKSAEEIFAAYQDYEQVFGQPHRAAWPAHRPGGHHHGSRRRLRIGYVSPDFREHAMRRFLLPVLEHHDKRQVEVWAYAEYAAPDAATAHYQSLVDHWVPTLGMDDDALAQRIQADQIDILVDLAGHSAGNRLGVFARKPAPVAASWLGYGYTTGLRAIDHLLSDAVCAPPGSEHLFSEAPWRLQPASLVYRPADGMGDVSPLPAAQHGQVTFGTLTRAIRINHRVLRAWSAILQRVPGARLVIDSKNYREPTMRQQLLAQFAAHGIAPERLAIGFHSPPWDVLRGIDIALDCFPHNSGTTLLEGLYMGVPYVTLAGRPGVGRLGAAFLHGMGMGDWVADSEQAYVDIAVAKAGDTAALAAIRASLRQRMRASPLMDEAGFTRRLEAAYRQMWERHVG